MNIDDHEHELTDDDHWYIVEVNTGAWEDYFESISSVEALDMAKRLRETYKQVRVVRYHILKFKRILSA